MLARRLISNLPRSTCKDTNMFKAGNLSLDFGFLIQTLKLIYSYFTTHVENNRDAFSASRCLGKAALFSTFPYCKF